jgi:hypothetical protein
MSLENDLKHALHRQSPAPGFASRVMERIEREEHHARPVWWRAVAASLTLTALLGGWAAHTMYEHREEERAKEQLILALRIAGQKVHYAQQEVREIGSQK